jgi:hypothetical protein
MESIYACGNRNAVAAGRGRGPAPRKRMTRFLLVVSFTDRPAGYIQLTASFLRSSVAADLLPPSDIDAEYRGKFRLCALGRLICSQEHPSQIVIVGSRYSLREETPSILMVSLEML